MKRRRLIALVSLYTLLGIGLLAAMAVFIVLRTDIARNFVRNWAASRVDGSVYVGQIRGNPLVGITIDSLAIRDKTGELFLSTGRVAADYDLRDIFDTRVSLHHVTAAHPYVHFRQYAKGDWNYQRIFKSTRIPAKPKGAAGRALGDYVVLDSVRGADASFILSLNWSPDDTLRGRVRDSVVKHEMARPDRNIAKTSDGYARTFSWTHANLMLPHVRLADPDSDKFGHAFAVATLDVDESDPPFRWRNIRGSVRQQAESVFIDFKHWDLPASTGSAMGKIVWGGPLPIRYDLTIPGDSVALNDVNWVYPTLPKSGGGKLVLLINNKRDVHVMDYALTHLDMRSTGSHLSGQMTFGVGAPVLQLRNVDLTANPVDFDLIKALNGQKFPIDWQGQIYGSVLASGGPLTDFEVDRAHAEFHDKHVPGAVSRFAGSGGLDILAPAFTAFHEFRLDVALLDLRTIKYLFPAFPKLNGTIDGVATLDSIWTDVRFRDADLTHRDGPGRPSRVLGSGRVTDGTKFITYDASLLADSLSFRTLARSPEFKGLKLKGMASGPITVKGQMPDLAITARLSGPGGQASYSGRLDLDSVGGYSAHGKGDFSRLDLSQVLLNPKAPVSSLTGHYDLAVAGASVSSLLGTASLNLSRSKLDSVVFDTSAARVQFVGGRAILTDTLKVNGPIGTLRAYGSIGLPGGDVLDSVVVAIDVDTVGALRPYLSAKRTSHPDSLTGSLKIGGVVKGNLDSLLITGTIAGDNLYVRGIDALKLNGTYEIYDALRGPHGSVDARFDSVSVAGLTFDSVRTNLTIADTTHGSYTLRGLGTGAESATDTVSLNADGLWSMLQGTTAVRLDSLLFKMSASTWTLDQPSTLTIDSTMFRVDTFALNNHHGGSIGIAGVVPNAELVDLRVTAVKVPLADIDRVAGVHQIPLTGLADFSARFTGTSANLTIDAAALLDSVSIADVRIGRLMSTAHVQNQRAAVRANIVRDAKQVLEASVDSLPIAVTLFSYDTLPGRVHALLNADSADFALIQTMVTGVSNVAGKMSGQVSIDGSWSDPIVTGQFAIHNGSLAIDTLGITLDSVSGTATYAFDTLHITRLSAISGDARGNNADLTGKIWFQKWSPKWFQLDLAMHNFEAYNRPELARVVASTDSGPVQLRGPIAKDTVTGYIAVPRGAIFLPDPKIASKRLKDQFDTPADATIAVGGRKDTTLYERVTQNLITDLRIHLGSDVALSADYAQIPLTGDLVIQRATEYSESARGTAAYTSRLAPEGTLYADRGSYTLDFAVIQREMQVEKGGTITFDRTADWNPLLNLTTRYNVRSYQRPDIPVIVSVTGRLMPSPQLSFSTDAPFPISESDLVSYLITGQPDFAGQSQAFRSLVSSVLAPSVSSILSNTLRGRLGSGVGLRVEAANPDFSAGSAGTQNQGAVQQLLGSVYSTRINGDVQVSDKLYFSLSAGLCQLGGVLGGNTDYTKSVQQGGFLNRLSEPFGGSFQYRLNSAVRTGTNVQFAVEPSTQALLCSASSENLRGVAATPRNYSLSFLKYWRW